MREIEFRGKTKDDRWVYGYLIADGITDKYYIFQKGNCCNENDVIGEEGYLHICTFEVILETIGQYTGLEDKNGTKIYEGDIVFVTEEADIATICWDEGTAMFIIVFDSWCTNFDHFNGEDLEVIGNIHDNKELLEE